MRILVKNRRAGDQSTQKQEVTAMMLVQQHNSRKPAATAVLNDDVDDDDIDDVDSTSPVPDVPSDHGSSHTVTVLRSVVATDPLAGDGVDAALQSAAAEAKATRSTGKKQKSKRRRDSEQADDAFTASTDRLVTGKQFAD